MMRSWGGRAIRLAGLVIAVGLAGCGGGSQQVTSSSAGQQRTQAPEVSAEVREAVLRTANSIYPNAGFTEVGCESAGPTHVGGAGGPTLPVYKCSLKSSTAEIPPSYWTDEGYHEGRLIVVRGIP